MLKLGENHRRVVSVLLRGLEGMCDEIETALDESAGILRHVSDDLPSGQREKLRRMSIGIRAEIRRLNSEIELDPAMNSRRRRIRALISSSIVNLEESDPKKLRGYGALSEEAVTRLQEEFERLLDMLREMAAVVEED